MSSAYVSCSLPPQHVKAIIEKRSMAVEFAHNHKQNAKAGWQQIKSCHVTFVRAT